MQFSPNPAFEDLIEVDINIRFEDGSLPVLNGSNLYPKLYKNIEMAASFFSVSGSRRVSAVLAENKRKIKLFEMEAEEDEEEDADMTTSVIKEDVSMQEEEENEGD